MSVHLKAAALEVARAMREEAECVHYGHALTRNPEDFTPDPECCTDAERERHAAALAMVARGEELPEPPPSWTEWSTQAEADEYARSCVRDGAAAVSTYCYDGQWIVHAHVGGWGIGTTVIRDEKMLSAADEVERFASELPGNDE